MQTRITSWLCLSLLCLMLFPQDLLSQSLKVPFHRQRPLRPQDHFFANDTTLNPKKKRWVNYLAGGGYALSMGYMGGIWYAQEDLSGFHFFDDVHEWKQMDKVGHVLGGYQFGRLMIDLYKWSGMSKKKAILTGGLFGFGAMTSIEILDGFGETWGFSWSDVGANALGMGLAMGNQALWNENRIQVKWSYKKSIYADRPDLERLFGTSYLENLLKDYNGQVYWLSVRVHSFLPESALKDIYPRWLNLAVGYGAEGMEGGYDDPNEAWRGREYRQYYLSLDIDLSNIETRIGWLNAVFSAINFIRIPFPALEWDKYGMRGRWNP
ncbi:MAG: DUF2279 domain-containing protein [Bacteroidota bacterium]